MSNQIAVTEKYQSEQQAAEGFATADMTKGPENSAFVHDEEQGLNPAPDVKIERKKATWWQRYLCCCIDWGTNYTDACIELFKLNVDNNDKVDHSQYFMQKSRDEFFDLLEQLGMLVDENKKAQFQQIIERHQVDDGLIGKFASHQQIMQFLYQIYNMQILDHYMIQKLTQFRKRAMDIFSLADESNDLILYKQFGELDLFWTLLEKQITHKKQQEFQQWIEEQKEDMEKVHFHQIQNILWTAVVDYELDIEELQKSFYGKKVSCASCCCLCRFARKHLIATRLSPKSPRDLHFGFSKIIAYSWAQLIHAFDIYTDLMLAVQFYILSREDIKPGSQDFTYHYNIGCTVVLIAIFGPYIIQYSTMMNVLHVKGYFQERNFKDFKCLKKIYLRAAFTFFGLLLMPIIDIFLKVQAFILFFMHLLPCIQMGKSKRVPISEWVQEKLEVFYEQLFDLNSVELENFEKQKKYIQVIFEDFIMVLLQIAILRKYLNVPKMLDIGDSQSKTIQSAMTTLLSIVTTLFQLYMESKGYREQACEYIMLSLKAKQDWIPFGQIIKRRQINFDIDYSVIELKIPIVTTLLGKYQNQEFQFSQANLNQLATTLDIILTKQSDSRRMTIQVQDIPEQNAFTRKNTQILAQEKILQNFIPRLKFGFSLMTVSVKAFLGFINKVNSRDQKYVLQYMDLNDIDWKKLIKNSKSFEQDLENGKTDSGKPLLQVCIENEDTQSKTWQLKPLMEQILLLNECNPNILDEYEQYNMLTYCYINQKHQAFDLIVRTSGSKLNINSFNPKKNTTIYGELFYHGLLLRIQNQSNLAKYKPLEKLQILEEYYGDKIDKHLNQVDIDRNKHSIVTPIFFFLDRYINNSNSSDSFQQIQQSQEFQDLFGKGNFQLDSNQEIQQVISYTLGKKRPAADDLIKEVNQRKGGLDEALRAKDAQRNNFMHVMGCRFSDKKWLPLIKDQKLETLIDIVQKLLREKNELNKTPIQTMLEDVTGNAIEVKGIIKLFDMRLVDLKNQETFKGIEHDVIIGFFDKAVENYKKKGGQKSTFIDRELFFQAFKQKFETYVTLKNRFKLAGQQHIFDLYFKSDSIEQNLQEYMNDPANKQTIDQLTEINLEFLMSKGLYDQKAIVQYKNTDLEPIQQLSSSVKTLLTNTELKEKQKVRYFVLELLLSFTIEIASVSDFISDLIVVQQLSQTIHTGWFTFSLFTMLAPYLTVYSSVMTFKIVDLRRQFDMNEFVCYGYVTTLVLILPTVVVILILFDSILMVVNIIIYIILCFGLLTPFSLQIYEYFEYIMNKFYSIIGMSLMDIKGFKSQRTILQLHLESLPQIFFQIYLLYKFKEITFLNQDSIDDSKKDHTGQVTTEALIGSIMAAFVHVILETINLYLESFTSETAFQDYMVACYSARLGWIPQEKDFYEIVQINNLELQNISDTDKDSNQIIQETEQSQKHQFNVFNAKNLDIFSLINADQKNKKGNPPIEFDHKDEKFLCCGYSVDFEFSNNSINYLFKIISNLKTIESQFRNTQKTLKLGACIKNVKLFNIIQLMRIAQNKITIEFDEGILRQIMTRDQNFIQSIKEPDNIKDSRYKYGEHLVVDIIKLNNFIFFKVMLEFGANINVVSRQVIYTETNSIHPKTNLFEIAYKLQSKKILALIIAKIGSENRNILHSIKDQEIFYKELKGDIISNPPKRSVQPLILLDPAMMIPYDLINSFNYNILNIIDSDPQIVEERWHIINGAYVPFMNYKKETKFIPLILKMVDWISMYPKKITLTQNTENNSSNSNIKVLELDSQFLCQFSAIRRAFFVDYDIGKEQQSQIQINIDILLQEKKLDLDDMLNVYKLYYSKLENLSVYQLQNCDQIIKQFGFDKNWGEYYYYSRKIQSGLEFKDFVHRHEVQAKQFEYTLPENIVAVKQLIIKDILDDSISECIVQFNFEMPHYKGSCNNVKPPAKSIQTQQIEQSEDKINTMQTLVMVNHDESENNDQDYTFLRFQNIMLNQIKGGHKIIIEVQDKQGQTLSCNFLIEVYTDLSNYTLEQAKNTQIHLNCTQN